MNRFRAIRGLLVAITVIFGAVLVGALAIHVYGAHRLANVSKNYEREIGPLSVQAFVRPKVAVEANAVTWQRPGVLAAVFFPGDMDVIGPLTAKRFATWTAEDIARLEVILRRNRPSIELLERARGMKQSNWDIPYQQGSTAKIPNLLAAINAAKMLNARGQLALGRGDRETALASVETLGALARSHESESTSFVVMIGLVIEKLEIALVHQFATSSLATPAELDRLEAALCDEDLIEVVRQSLRGGTAAIVHDVGSKSRLREIHDALYWRLARVFSNVVAATAIESHGDAEKHLGEPVQAPLDGEDEGRRKDAWWKPLFGAYAANYASISARATATVSARELARLAIALQREAQANGRYPATLPAIEGVSPTDPLTGEPRVYESRADGSVELRSTTTLEIIRSISPGGQLFYDSLYRWPLPAPRDDG